MAERGKFIRLTSIGAAGWLNQEFQSQSYLENLKAGCNSPCTACRTSTLTWVAKEEASTSKSSEEKAAISKCVFTGIVVAV